MNIKNDISVILPVYNGGSYLKESVISVLKQNLKSFEFIILDDNSDDGSFEWLETLDDNRIVLLRNETNKGLFYNLNILINQSKTPLIKLWAQDDVMHEDCLLGFTTFYKIHPEVGFIYCAVDNIDERGNLRPALPADTTPMVLDTLMHAQIAYFTGSIAGNIANVCLTRTGIEKVGLFDETMKISGDFDMWVRLAEHFSTGFLNTKLIKLRDHSGQLSRDKKFLINHVKEDLRIYRYLDSYVSEPDRVKGKKMMRSRKLVFYYTLMVQALIKGKFKNAWLFYKELSAYDNFILLSYSFFQAKIFKRKINSFKAN